MNLPTHHSRIGAPAIIFFWKMEGSSLGEAPIQEGNNLFFSSKSRHKDGNNRVSNGVREHEVVILIIRHHQSHEIIRKDKQTILSPMHTYILDDLETTFTDTTTSKWTSTWKT
uniref:Uncharacterized protein n=1 Tax=Eutreptiella gymnastica TaxID=73025 RepID=A0A7S1HXK2_9EUGL|mmetsp:Transcript_112966/g.196107  ORF Transcript_112966/g.196107 Transcript_112966/m.196107 type:complete len:113 (+) Transcript_112966:211-549(+)